MSSSPALVTVLIPAFNPGDWLQKAVRSALAQRAISVRVIVCDDGSTDGSIDSLAGFDREVVTVLRQNRRGGGAARNALLAACNTEWTQFLDADDYLEPEKISRQMAEAGDLSAADVLYSPVWIETWKGDRALTRAASAIDRRCDIFAQWISWQLPQTGGPLWRTAALRRIGGWKENLPCCQEHELYLRSLQAGLQWQYCASPGAVYRVWSEETVCRRDPVQVIRQRSELIEGVLTWLDQRGARTQAHDAAAGLAFFEMARSWAKYDLDAAAAFYFRHSRRGLIQLSGPAAPFSYRITQALLGFRGAEALARVLRSRRLSARKPVVRLNAP